MITIVTITDMINWDTKQCRPLPSSKKCQTVFVVKVDAT